MIKPDQQRRRVMRGEWPVTKLTLGAADASNLLESTTPEQRIAMVWELTLEAWSLMGKPVASARQSRSVVRRAGSASSDR